MRQNKLIYEEPILEMVYLYDVVDTLVGSDEGNMGEEDFDVMFGKMGI